MIINTIYDELNLNINPYKELGLDAVSSTHTIKEAYQILLKSGLSPDKKEIIEISYNMIKNDLLKKRFNLIRNKPYDSLDNIKDLGLKPMVLETRDWLNYLL